MLRPYSRFPGLTNLAFTDSKRLKNRGWFSGQCYQQQRTSRCLAVFGPNSISTNIRWQKAGWHQPC